MNISRWPKTDTRWYLGVRCQKCHVPILFALDHSEGSEERQIASAGKLVLTCTLEKCGFKADYSHAAVLRFQKAAAAAAGHITPTGRNNEGSKSGKHKR